MCHRHHAAGTGTVTQASCVTDATAGTSCRSRECATAPLAAHPERLLVGRALSNRTTLSLTTVQRYLALLEEVFLIKRAPAWSRTLSKR